MAPPKLSAFKCPSCSAPLEAAPEQTDIRCHYCGNSIHIERQKPSRLATAAQRPVNTVYIDPNAGKMVGGIILLTVVLPVVLSVLFTVAIPVVIVLIVLGAALGKGYFVSFPTTCDHNEELTISGKTFEGTGTLITTNGNCKLTIKDSTLKGNVVVKSEGLSEVKIINSKIEGATAALDLGGNTKVKISDKSEIKSPGAAILGKTNLELTIEDSTVDGGDAAFNGGSGAKVVATRAKLLGKDAAVILESNADLTLKESTVKSDGAAVTGGSNMKLTADASSITGGDDGIHAEPSLVVKLAKKSALKATRIAIETSSNCDLQFDDSTVDSDDTAIYATSSCKLKIVNGARVTGKSIGFEGTSSSELVLQSGTLSSGGTAYLGTSNIEIDAKKSAIKGGANAFLLDDKPSRLNLTETEVTGAQVFDARESQKPTPAAPTHLTTTPVPTTPRATTPRAAPKPVAAPPFNGEAARAALDAAAKSAEASCRSTRPGKEARVMIYPGFRPDGSNADAWARAPFKGTAEGLCVEAVFKQVKIPPFDPATLNGGMMRYVTLN